MYAADSVVLTFAALDEIFTALSYADAKVQGGSDSGIKINKFAFTRFLLGDGDALTEALAVEVIHLLPLQA